MGIVLHQRTPAVLSLDKVRRLGVGLATLSFEKVYPYENQSRLLGCLVDNRKRLPRTECEGGLLRRIYVSHRKKRHNYIIVS